MAENWRSLDVREESVDSSCDETTSERHGLSSTCTIYIALGFLCKRNKRVITFAIGSCAWASSHTTHRDHRHTFQFLESLFSTVSSHDCSFTLRQFQRIHSISFESRLYPPSNILGCQCTFIICLLMHGVVSCKVWGRQPQAMFRLLICLIFWMFKNVFPVIEVIWLWLIWGCHYEKWLSKRLYKGDCCLFQKIFKHLSGGTEKKVREDSLRISGK